ncbi:hypothetical protein VP01_9957g1 [Puccinia sorghi]|uniref:Uncharacterized protein n=1 Tax=Puccinia sorghi TaxID=27349 RepID=A0A0L6U5A7_9BASI|nr:hypothetical protein VP01_9957g1 [Puccinia sorghi]
MSVSTQDHSSAALGGRKSESVFYHLFFFSAPFVMRTNFVYFVHDEKNGAKRGDKVQIVPLVKGFPPTRPIPYCVS